MNSSHKVNVIHIKEILPHTNADTLGIVQIGGYQCVVKKDDFKVGELAVYVQPDSIVPQTEPFKFLWADREFTDGIVPESKRRITVRRFRREWSEGLLLPASSFPELYTADGMLVDEGDDVSELLGIKHYVEPEPIDLHGKKTREQYKTWPPRSLKGFFYWFMYKLGFDFNGPTGGDAEKPPKNTPPVYDVESYKNYPRLFVPGEPVIVTEKIHGSNGRYMFDGKKMWVGSKNLWKSEKSTCIWRRALKQLPWIEEFCKAHEGCVLYVEVVPTQSGYAYGTTDTAPINVFAFDIRYTAEHDEYGEWVPVPKGMSLALLAEHFAPVLYRGPYDEGKIKSLVEGPSTVPGAKHIREGIVISSETERHVRGVGRAQLKLKSNAFLEKETK